MKLRKIFRVGRTISVPNGTRKPLTPPFVRMRYVRWTCSVADREFFPGRDPWTKEEDEKVWEAFQKLGNKWHAISCTLNGRPGLWAFLSFVLISRILSFLHQPSIAVTDYRVYNGFTQPSRPPPIARSQRWYLRHLRVLQARHALVSVDSIH